MDTAQRQTLIPFRRYFSLRQHDPEQLRPLVDAALTILERTGVQCDAPAALDVFAEAGAAVDRDTRRVRLSAELIEAALNTVPPTFTLCARDPQLDLPSMLGQERSGEQTRCQSRSSSG